MKKHFLLLLLLTLLPLAGWSANIAVQLSTSLQKVYGTADPTTLSPTQFVITADGGTGVTESEIAEYLTFKRKPGSTGESVGTYDWEVTVSEGWTGAPIVATNTGRITITPLDLSNVLSENLSADLTGSPFTYDGNAKEPTVTNVTAYGSNLDPSDYTISYEDNVNAGTAKVIITAASGNVTGSNFITFSIGKRTLAQNDLTIDDIPSVPFNASYWKPELNIKYGEVALEKGTDYTVAYTNNSNPGTATATVTLQGNYQNDGVIKKDFTITKYDLSNDADYASKIQVTGYSGLVYDGKAKTPAVTVKLNGVTYANAYVSRSWENNINATTENSKATLTLTGAAGAFKGTKKIEVEIAPKELSTEIIGDIAEQTYNGNAKEPVFTVSFNNGEEDVTLTKDVDYTVSYENNTNAGTATATITAVEGTNYTGTATKEFTINPVTVYIKPVDQSKFYGQADPNFAQPTTAMYELVDGEGNKVEKAVLNGTVALGRKAGETVGNYAIYVKSYSVNPEVKDNYKPNNEMYVDDDHLGNYTALFTINAQEAKLILKFKEGTPATKVYGDPTYAYSVDDLEAVSGLAGSDTWETLKGGATFDAALESEDVHHDGNKVTATITGLANYPNIEVQPLAFTVTKRKFGVKVSAQKKDYGKAIAKAKNYWAKAAASTYAFDGTSEQEDKDDVLVELYTDEDVATFAPGSVHEGAIKARIADESNYELDLDNSAWGTLTINAATALALDDSKDDNLTKIEAFDGKTGLDVEVQLSNRAQTIGSSNFTWGAKEYQILVLPFDVTVSEISAQLGYAVVNVVNKDKATADNIYWSLEWGTIPANTPFTVRTAEAIPAGGKTLSFTDKKIEAPETAYPSVDAGNGFKVVGAYEEYTIDNTSASKKRFYAGGQHHGIKESSTNTSWTIKPFNGYVDLSGSATAPEFVTFTFEDIDGSTTAIRSITAETAGAAQTYGEGWYTLNGVKLQGAPVEKGVYIKDGKKVVVK